MAGTRSTKARPAKSAASQKSEDIDASSNATPGIKLEARTGEQLKVFILPSQATSEARIVTLQHPRLSQPTRYLVCPKTGIYEFIKMSATKASPRSWLLEAVPGSGGSTEVIAESDLFVATSLDPLFLILPALFETTAARDAEDRKHLFLQSDDFFDKLPQHHSHMFEILRWAPTRSLIEARMEAVCDTVEAGDETMFRLNQTKLMATLLEKAKRMSREGLPPSIEERLVKRALEAPLVLKKSEIGAIQIGTGGSGTDAAAMKSGSSVSQPSSLSRTNTDASSISRASTAATSISDETSGEILVSAIEASPEAAQLQRLRVSFDFICSTYMPEDLASQLKRSLRNGEADSVDFSALDDYLARLERLKSETVATTSTADFSRRRRRDEEEEDERQEKKRRMEEAKKKKASESKALRDLKKVDTSGMKKLSAFFTKK